MSTGCDLLDLQPTLTSSMERHKTDFWSKERECNKRSLQIDFNLFRFTQLVCNLDVFCSNLFIEFIPHSLIDTPVIAKYKSIVITQVL